MFASALAANGGTVIVTSRKESVVMDTVNEINNKYKSKGGKAIGIAGDLSTLKGVEDFVAALTKQVDKVHILVNNAGATWGGNLGEFPDKAWPRVMDLNVRHLFNLTQLLLPMLKKASTKTDPARVVMVASVEGQRATLTMSPFAAYSYGASKAAVIYLTKALARSFAQHDYFISVNCICPGLFPSNMSKDIVAMSSGENNPMKRNGRTADMAATLLYLCGPGGSFTNGSIITVDGGLYLLS